MTLVVSRQLHRKAWARSGLPPGGLGIFPGAFAIFAGAFHPDGDFFGGNPVIGNPGARLGSPGYHDPDGEDGRGREHTILGLEEIRYVGRDHAFEGYGPGNEVGALDAEALKPALPWGR